MRQVARGEVGEGVRRSWCDLARGEKRLGPIHWRTATRPLRLRRSSLSLKRGVPCSPDRRGFNHPSAAGILASHPASGTTRCGRERWRSPSSAGVDPRGRRAGACSRTHNSISRAASSRREVAESFVECSRQLPRRAFQTRRSSSPGTRGDRMPRQIEGRELRALEGTHWWRQAAHRATSVMPVVDEWGRPVSPHPGQGPGTRGCHGLLHPHTRPAAPASRTGTIG